MASIGFTLLTHDKPQRIERLIRRLWADFESPIVCHHDFSCTPLETTHFPPGVRVLRPHVAVTWGGFSMVTAILAAIEALYTSERPDWYILLSGADYPIKSAKQIRDDLERTPFDGFIQHERIDPGSFANEWHRICYERYFGINLRLPRLGRKGLTWETRLVRTQHVPLINYPFSRRFGCFAGGTWFTLHRRAIEYLLDPDHLRRPRHRALQRRYRGRFYTDESYIHSILGNAPHLRLTNDSKRYIDWSANAHHPKILTCEDLPRMLASDAHFARKFDPDVDEAVLDRLDEIISA